MHTVIEPREVTIRIEAQGAYWMPTKARAIEMAFDWLKGLELDANQWRETGAHKATDHSWIVGLAIK